MMYLMLGCPSIDVTRTPIYVPDLAIRSLAWVVVAHATLDSRFPSHLESQQPGALDYQYQDAGLRDHCYPPACQYLV
jgi:hypothetical protein